MNREEALEFFDKFLSVIKGKTDLKSRIAILLNPSNPQTSSNLSLGQADYLRDAHWIANVYPEFEPLKEDADQLALSMLSKDGYGVNKTIDLQRSLTERTVRESTVKETEKIKDAKQDKEKEGD